MSDQKRLIDANALISQYPEMVFTAQVNYAEGMRNVIEDIRNAPTVDAVEVVHGRWEEADDGDGVVCSACGTDFCVLLNETDNFKYCPNCGAKMDGDGNA